MRVAKSIHKSGMLSIVVKCIRLREDAAVHIFEPHRPTSSHGEQDPPGPSHPSPTHAPWLLNHSCNYEAKRADK